MRSAMVRALTESAQKDSDVMLLTADLGFSVFEEFAEQMPNQYINVGVSEQNMIGVATGLALEGKKIFAYSIGNFPTLRCLEQIRNDACYHELNINIICSGGGLSYGSLGISHHATEDLSIMRAIPGITVIAPCTKSNAYHAVKALLKQPGVGYLRIEKNGFDHINDESFQIGKAYQLRSGSDVAIIATGGILEEALAAADKLANENISASVVSMPTVKPVDKAFLEKLADHVNFIVTLEENNIIGGLGSAIIEACMDKHVSPPQIIRMGLRDKYSSIVGNQHYLRKKYGLDSVSVVAMIKQYLGN